MFYRVPSCLAGHREDAERFEKYWNALVSPGEVVYAHSKPGKAAIDLARTNGMVSQTVQHLKDVYL